MFPDSAIDTGLIQAFRETHYRVHGAEPFTLRVDEPSTALAAAHKRFRTDCSAFITACNPFSEDVGAASNAQRHADLGLELARRSLAVLADPEDPRCAIPADLNVPVHALPEDPDGVVPAVAELAAGAGELRRGVAANLAADRLGEVVRGWVVTPAAGDVVFARGASALRALYGAEA